MHIAWKIAFGFAFLVAGAAAWLYYTLLVATPPFKDLQSKVSVPIIKANGEKSTRLVGPAAPGWVPLDNISPYMVHAVISSEDTSFYSHKGVDMHEIREAVKKDLKEKRYARGASTITQQVIKNVFLSSEKSLWRKFKEFVWAGEMEKVLSKSQILSFYLNMVELGPGIYGVGRASEYYFGIPPSALGLKQSAFLTMLLPSPTKYHNHYFEKKQLTPWANGRIERTLHVMHKMGFINEESYQAALSERLWDGEVPDLVETLDTRPLYEDSGDTLEEVPSVATPQETQQTGAPQQPASPAMKDIPVQNVWPDDADSAPLVDDGPASPAEMPDSD